MMAKFRNPRDYVDLGVKGIGYYQKIGDKTCQKK